MDLAQLVLVFLSCIMFIAVVTTLVRAGRGSSRGETRLVSDPSGEGWLSVEEVAELLETDPEDVLGLVDRGSIPFFVGRPFRPIGRGDLLVSPRRDRRMGDRLTSLLQLQ